ncbi:Allantoinase [Mucor velutinosus]|uniref:Allantoinase n=1 Tax=Mucor velutinosus TaxID=708070 RepID=A0AAN7DBY4_9FUNG|nr:Allantoinase [Mucor velutinosus]
MPTSISKLYQSAKSKLSNRRKSSSSTDTSGSSESATTTSKSVRFSSRSNVTIYDTYSSEEYDRRSSISADPQHEADSLHHDIDKESLFIQEEDDDPIQFSDEVVRNTKVNKKQSHYSIAVLVNYRANF